uniref:Cystinosin homolog n=1 Tax=Plectus sambesii TaxID=2011161 RepID=A0A914VLD7_9BILA
MLFAVIVGIGILLTSQQALGQNEDENLVGNATNPHTTLKIWPRTVMLVVNDSTTLYFESSHPLLRPVNVHFNDSSYFAILPPDVRLSANVTAPFTAQIKGLNVTSDLLVQPASCSYWNGSTNLFSDTDCPFTRLNKSGILLTVVHSYWLLTLCNIVGWIYFFAWSISFYPQIWLNFSRKSVVGLNFDFIALNMTGFACYTIYNVIMFWDPNVHALYEIENPHTSNPVMLNDVVFAIHAIFACSITAIQCSIYERGQQRVSYLGGSLVGVFCLVAVGSFAVAIFKVINWLQFIRLLSYIKIGVTLSKYFPQAFFNYQRKSTVGWSIGNILLDFTGGSMDILQMVLQSLNTDDWRNFTGNKVKFLLGLISIAFDILFMVQHYVLYRNSPETKYEHLDGEHDNSSSRPSVLGGRPDYGSTEDLSSASPQNVQ